MASANTPGLSTVADELMMSTAGSPLGGSAIARERVIAATRNHARTCRSVDQLRTGRAFWIGLPEATFPSGNRNA
jgi:hypothetical protein